MALAAFLLGLAAPFLQLLTALPALFLGLFSLRAINAADGRLRGRRLAIAGLVLGTAGVVLATLAFVWVVLASFRQTADRVACANNLRQLGLGVSLYTDRQKVFPPATFPTHDFDPEKRTSWIALILDYVDVHPEKDRRYADLQGRLALAQPWDVPPNREVSHLVLPFCICPAHPASDDLVGRTDYVGLSGLGIDAATYSEKNARIGAFGYDRLLRPVDVTAGLAFTLQATETAQDNGPWLAGGPSTVRGIDPDVDDYIGENRSFGGFHPGGMNALWMDGHVDFLREHLEPEVLREQVRVRR
jgi:prepilin-type processing-associated H-X9-DG protein